MKGGGRRGRWTSAAAAPEEAATAAAAGAAAAGASEDAAPPALPPSPRPRCRFEAAAATAAASAALALAAAAAAAAPARTAEAAVAGGGLAGGGAATAVARSCWSRTSKEARVSAAERPEKCATSRACRGPRLTRAWAAACFEKFVEGKEGEGERKRRSNLGAAVVVNQRPDKGCISTPVGSRKSQYDRSCISTHRGQYQQRASSNCTTTGVREATTDSCFRFRAAGRWACECPFV
jgi:hypothetical protein